VLYGEDIVVVVVVVVLERVDASDESKTDTAYVI
jgi:hypothetical protein